MSELPTTAVLVGPIQDGWSSGVLSDYIERPQYGHTDSASDDASGTKFLRITDIQDGQVNWPTVPYCKCHRSVLDSKRLLPGDVVVARIGATTGKSFYIDSTPNEAIFASYLIRLRAKPGRIHPRYLYYYMQTAEYWAHVDLHKGNRLKGGVNIAVLESLPVLVPSPAEQAQIVRVLDAVQSAVRSEAARASHTAGLHRAAMSELFTRGLRDEDQKESEFGPVPASWAVEVIDERWTVRSGTTPARSNAAFWDGGTIPWVKTAELRYTVISETEEHITAAAVDSGAARIFPKDTLLLAMYGQGVTRGKVGMLGVPAACNQACAAITPKDDRLTRRFLFHLLSWRYEAIRNMAHGGQQQNLNLDIVRALPIAYPTDHAEQAAIVAILDTAERKIAIHRQRHAVLERLFAELLHQLMTQQLSVGDLDLSELTGHEASELQVGAV